MIGTGTPADAKRWNRSSSETPCNSGLRYAIEATGLVSVMPQPWRISAPCRAKARISASGTGAPPTSIFMPGSSR